MINKTTFDTKEVSGTYNDGLAVRNAVFEKIVKFCKRHVCYSGDSLMQDEFASGDAQNLLADLIDDELKFKIVYKE